MASSVSLTLFVNQHPGVFGDCLVKIYLVILDFFFATFFFVDSVNYVDNVALRPISSMNYEGIHQRATMSSPVFAAGSVLKQLCRQKGCNQWRL
jgi:hypothetical protein